MQSLRNHVALIAPGTTVKLGVFRDKKQTEVPLTIGQQPDDTETLAAGGQPGAPKHESVVESAEAFGMHLSDVTDELANKYGLNDPHGGALITSVKPKSVAANSQLMPGDLITSVDGKKVANAGEAADALSKVDPKKGARLYITNAQGSGFVFLGDQDQ